MWYFVPIHNRITDEVTEWIKSKLLCFLSDFCEAKNFSYRAKRDEK